jgi:hypothetical protein
LAPRKKLVLDILHGGDIGEILFYGSALSKSDRSTVNGYLKSRYALP